MIKYDLFKLKNPEIIINIPGIIYIENKENITINLEVDYNSFSKEELNKIIGSKINEFNSKTNCITYKDKIKENNLYVPINDFENKNYLKIKTENNLYNFHMIKTKLSIFKNENKIYENKKNHSKQINISLSDGFYIFKFDIYNSENEFINCFNLNVNLKTNYNQLFNNKTLPNEIIFNENEGNFKLILAANYKKLYSFKIIDIISKNDSIFDFSYFNSKDNSPAIKGKIGSDIRLLNDKQIEEIIKNPSQEQLIKPEFVFDIKEIFTTKHSKDDIGIVKIPTIKSKLRDTGSRYYDLKCDVSQNYVVDIDKTNNFLITDKFSSEPLFYKFMINCAFKEFKLLDNDNNLVDYTLESIADKLHIVYFNPIREKQYYAYIDDYVELVTFKKSYESFKILYNKNIIESESFYFGDIMILGEGTYNVTVTFEDYNKKTFAIKGIDKECKFLEDERVKIDNKVISIVVDREFENIINMICPLKNNRTNYSFFKKNNQDFVYLATEVKDFNLEDISESSLSNITLGNRYIYQDNLLKEVPNGPIYLEEIKKTDIVFTDIETWVKENTISENVVLHTGIKDNYFNENIVDNNMEVKYEDK